MDRKWGARRSNRLLGALAVPALLVYLSVGRPAPEGAIYSGSAAELRSTCTTADAWLRSMRDAAPETGAKGSDALADALERLGDCLGRQGRYSEARPLFERSLTIRERLHGPEHASVAAALDALGWLLVHSGRHTEADSFYRRALSIRTRGIGPEHSDTARTLAGLAYLRFLQERFDEAKELALVSLRIRERTLGPWHLAVAESVNLIGLIDQSRGRLLEARFEFERALGIHDNRAARTLAARLPFPVADGLLHGFGWLAPEHPDKGSVLSNLASVQVDEGRLTEAQESLEHAVEIFERSLEPRHPFVGRALTNLGSVYQSQGKPRLAEQAYVRAIDILEGPPSVEQHGLGLALQDLGSLQIDEGRFAEARSNLERAIAILSQTLAPGHSHLVKARGNLKVCRDALVRRGGATADHAGPAQQHRSGSLHIVEQGRVSLHVASAESRSPRAMRGCSRSARAASTTNGAPTTRIGVSTETTTCFHSSEARSITQFASSE